MKTILVLEDNEERIADFIKAVRQLGDGYEVKFWRDAHSMCRECEASFSTAALVSLDHDLARAAILVAGSTLPNSLLISYLCVR